MVGNSTVVTPDKPDVAELEKTLEAAENTEKETVAAGPTNVITASGKTIQVGQIATIGGQKVRLAIPGANLLKAVRPLDQDYYDRRGAILSAQKRTRSSARQLVPKVSDDCNTAADQVALDVPKEVEVVDDENLEDWEFTSSDEDVQVLLENIADKQPTRPEPAAAGPDKVITVQCPGPQIVKSIGAGNVVPQAKPGQTVARKQTIVINRPGAQGTAITGAQGQQNIMVSGLKQLGGTATTSQARLITISMPGGQKTVALSSSAGAKEGRVVQTSPRPILPRPSCGSGIQKAMGGQKTPALVQVPKVKPQASVVTSDSLETTKSQFICHMCLRSPTASYVLNCGHLPFCEECSILFIREGKKCPLCKCRVMSRHRVYLDLMKTKAAEEKDDSNVISLDDDSQDAF